MGKEETPIKYVHSRNMSVFWPLVLVNAGIRHKQQADVTSLGVAWLCM
jgi:hypothetical protein